MRFLSIMVVGVFSLAIAALADDPPPEVQPEPSDCWVELYDEPTLEGKMVRFEGPLSTAKLADVEYEDGEKLNDDVRGVRTGPTARVVLFEKAGFEGKVYEVAPGSSESISSEGFGDDASSFKVTCE